MRPSDFKTTDIKLSAAIMTATGKKPQLIRPGRELIEFVFPMNDDVETVVMKYSSGSLMQEVQRLFNNHSWLYRQIREFDHVGRDIRP